MEQLDAEMMLDAEIRNEKRLHRVPGSLSLTALGVGAIIGAGIFVTTGWAAVMDAGLLRRCPTPI